MRSRNVEEIRADGYGTEEDFARRRTARWLLGVMEQNAAVDAGFLRCLCWALGGLDGILKDVAEKAGKLRLARDAVTTLRELRGVREMQDHVLYACEELFSSNARLKALFLAVAADACRSRTAQATDDGLFATARRRLVEVFGLNEEGCVLCEFVFMIQQFPEVETYFEDDIKVFGFGARRLLARILELSVPELRRTVSELLRLGMVETAFGSALRITESVLAFWEPEEPDAQELFFRPLEGETLPLKDFHVPADHIRHVLRLLKRRGDEPVHVLLYGASGTGKTSLVRSLAAACGVKAWFVVSRERDGDAARRASLTACLHMASRHEGAFVVVDEAERLLDTDVSFGRDTKDKAWLNDFMECAGRRVIWITNEVEHLDPAVRRRFSFSIHFESLGVKERVAVWRQVMRRSGFVRRFSEPVMTELAVRYPVEAAVIQKAVSQSSGLCRTRKDFYASLDRILQAHVTLQADGNYRAASENREVGEFSLDGVCMEGDAAAFMERCRRMDAAMRGNARLRPGCATMLFYGPPGTGKTALAGYVAKTLGRACLSRRASDLMGPFVGLTEQNIAGAFREAEERGAVLVVDEADSFLFSREGARMSWESSMVNEFLTSLERCRTFCICTTNRREELDAAAMRRFSCKVAFRYAEVGQVRRLYEAMLAPLCEGELSEALLRRLMALKRLAPGDFHVVRMQHDPMIAEPGSVTHEALVAALEREVALKKERAPVRMGFMG